MSSLSFSATSLISLTSGDSSVTYYSYDNANRVTEIQHKTSGGTSTAEHEIDGYFCNIGRCFSCSCCNDIDDVYDLHEVQTWKLGQF